MPGISERVVGKIRMARKTPFPSAPAWQGSKREPCQADAFDPGT
jgi:hypothetical protein